MTKLKFVYRFLPAIVRYTYNMPKPWYGGSARYCYIRIRLEDKYDIGVLKHELVHVEQFYRLLFSLIALSFGLLLCSLSWPSIGLFIGYIILAISAPTIDNFLSCHVSKYRLMIEVEAYREQLKHYKDDRTELFADFLSTKEYYRLNITKEKAIELLKK